MTLSPREFAARSGLSVSQVWKKLERGSFGSTARKVGRIWAIEEVTAAEYLGVRLVESLPQRGGLGSTKLPSIEEIAALEKFWKAQIAELKYRTAAAKLVDREAAIALYAREVAAVRERIRRVPRDLVQRVQLPAASVELLIDLFEEALEDLGRGATRLTK